MSVFGSIMSAIFGGGQAAGTQSAQPAAASSPSPSSAGSAGSTGAGTTAQGGGASAAAPAGTGGGSGGGSGGGAGGSVDVAAVLEQRASEKDEELDWRRSIVDLMKVLDLDSSLSARKALAQELHYTANTNDSAAMNMWLHKQVMQKLAENGGRVPEELKH